MVSSNNVYSIQVVIVAIILAATTVLSDDHAQIPADKTQLNRWFSQNVRPLSMRKRTLDPALVAAEAHPKVITVSQRGRADFRTITAAVKSIPTYNKQRVIIKIAGGVYREKVTVDYSKDFVTFLGDAKNMPTIVYNGNAAKYGTVDSATVITYSNYFVASNIIFKNSSPMPRPDQLNGAQAVALRVSGDKSAFYNCVFLGFQDTVCDDKGNHLFKDCLIQGTVDFVFGKGKSLYLNTKLVVVGTIPGVIVAQARTSNTEDRGFSFVHCDISGSAKGSLLGRAWMSHGRAVFSYSTISNVIAPEAWSIINHPESAKTVYFAEFQNRGVGARGRRGRAPFTKFLTGNVAKQYLNLGYIQGSKWLLPPPRA